MIENIVIPEERLRILKKNKKMENKLKQFVDVKMEFNDSIKIESDDPIAVMKVKEVIKAFGRGFDFDTALNLIDEDYFLDIIDVKDFSGKSRNRQVTLKGRVIGTRGKTKNIIERYADVKIVIYGKTISIVGKAKNVRIAREAIEMLLSGSNHRTVYRFLEENKVI